MTEVASIPSAIHCHAPLRSDATWWPQSVPLLDLCIRRRRPRGYLRLCSGARPHQAWRDSSRNCYADESALCLPVCFARRCVVPLRGQRCLMHVVALMRMQHAGWARGHIWAWMDTVGKGNSSFWCNNGGERVTIRRTPVVGCLLSLLDAPWHSSGTPCLTARGSVASM